MELVDQKVCKFVSFYAHSFCLWCADCGKNGPETNEEMRKDALSLLAEELSLQKDVADDNLQRTKALITAAKKTSSHYQKEAEKCNAGMETCEEAREKAEAGLIEERKLSALWEKRAHEHGWKDERRVYQWELLDFIEWF